MYVIFVVIALLSDPNTVVTTAHSNKTFDTVAACEAERQPMVDRNQEALAAQGVTVKSSECLTVEDAEKKAAEQANQ